MSTAEQLLGDLARAPEHHLEALSGREAAKVVELRQRVPVESFRWIDATAVVEPGDDSLRV
jgi:hypothetical protein